MSEALIAPTSWRVETISQMGNILLVSLPAVVS